MSTKNNYCQAKAPAELSCISTSAPPTPTPPGKVFEAQVKPKLQPQLPLSASLGLAQAPALAPADLVQLYFAFHPPNLQKSTPYLSQ